VRVLHVSPYFRPAYRYGGPIESVYRLCLNLARIGCDVRALTTNADGLDQVLRVNLRRTHVIVAGFEVRYCARVMRHAVSPSLLRNLIPYVKWADVVHLTAVYSFTTLPTLMACRHYRKPLVWSPRGALQRWSGSRRQGAKRLWEMACRARMPRDAMLHATSEAERADSLARFSKLKAVVIPNGVVVPRAVQHQPGDGILRIGYLGRLDPKKGIENLIDAARIARRSGTPLRLVIAGSGAPEYEASLRARIEQCGLGGDAELTGHLEGAAKTGFFERLDIAAVPSYTENFAIVVAEALAHGVPVIASKGTPWARVDEMGCGMWVANDAESLARAIAAMASMPLAEMGERGRRWMLDEFSWQRVTREMYGAYASMLRGRKVRRRRRRRVAAGVSAGSR
jgi:glycosyltransferase involved in cell wall biosynthesis